MILARLLKLPKVAYPRVQRRQRTDRRRRGRRIVAQITVRHPQHPLPIVLLASFRNHVAIGKQVVHRRQPGRPFIADPGDLDRGRLAGEDQQPVVSRVSRQVEKDVDPVRPDLLRQPLVAHADHVAPLGRGGLKTMSQVVLDDPVGVTDRLRRSFATALTPCPSRRERGDGKVLQDADQEIADRVPPQIGRNEAQTEPAVTIANALACCAAAIAQRRRVPAIVLGMGLGQCCRRYARAILECKEQVAVGLGIVRLQFQCPAVAGDRFVQLPLVLQHVAQVVVRLGIVRLQFQCPAAAGNRFVQLSLVLQGNAQVVVCLGIVRLQFQRPAVAGDRFVQLSLVLEGKAQVVVRLGKVRLQFQCPAAAGDRFVQLPLVLQDDAQVVVGLGIVRVSVPVPGGSRRPLRPASPAP